MSHKNQILSKLSAKYKVLFLIVLGLFFYHDGFTQNDKKDKVISYVDTSLDGSQKYVLRVGDKPYYMINIQLRMDNLRYVEGWDIEDTEALIARAANDGFNTVSIPVHWREIEPEKDKFDWSVIDEYMSLVNKYNLKMEMLWFGTNSGGITQRLGKSNHLRTPDYVMYSPEAGTKSGYGSYSPDLGRTATTSEYIIRREVGDYSLDLKDTELRDRETYVLSKTMEHIAEWDKANGSKHPLIGVQIGNEVIGYGNPFPNTLVIDYLSHVASAVKNSDYVVWTRVNSVFWYIPARIIENESRRSSPQGTNIDFVGIDTYRHHFETDNDFMASMRYNVPYVGKNYRMVMETGSGEPNAAQLRLAALSGNNAFSYYDFSRIYYINEDGIKPKVAHIEDIRLVNKIIGSDIADIALNAHGYGLFVHNWIGVKSVTSTSPQGISFAPDYPTSQGVSILRSNTEIVLMCTKGGRFSLPDSMKVTGASQGYFNSANEWVDQGEVNYRGWRGGASIYTEPGMTVRLTCENNEKASPIIRQAEFAQLNNGAEAEASVESIGFAGNGYAKLPSTGGASVLWTNVDGLLGGSKNVRFRYSKSGEQSSKLMLEINGKIQFVHLQPTGSKDTYRYFTIGTDLNSGPNNDIRLETTNNTLRIDRVVYYEGGLNIDELQIF